MTVLRTHSHDGTVGAAATTANSGYDSLTGTAPLYIADGYQNQALEWTSAATSAILNDNLAASYALLWVRFPSLPTSDMAVVAFMNGSSAALGSVVVNSTGHVLCYNAFLTSVATSTLTLSPNTWYWFAYHCDGTTQELRIGNALSSTPLETLTGAAAASGPAAKFRVGLPWAGKSGTSGNKVDVDEVQVGDDWITPTIVSDTGVPMADVTITSWTLSSGSTAYPLLNDALDTTFVTSSVNPSGLVLEEKLTAMTGPPGTVTVRIARSSDSTSGSAVVDLVEGTTVRATWTQSTLTTSPTDYTFNTTPTQRSAITAYTDLRVRVTVTAA